MRVDTRISPLFTQFDLESHTVMSATTGSVARNMNLQTGEIGTKNDTDAVIVVVPPPRLDIGLEHFDVADFKIEELDVNIFSARKVIGLCLANNPTFLELLWSEPDYIAYASAPWREILKEREIFSSQRIAKTFWGYAQSQLNEMISRPGQKVGRVWRPELVERFGYDTKAAAHALRLLRQAGEMLQTGILQVWRPDGDELRAVRRGEWNLEQIKREVAKSNLILDRALTSTRLPQRPDKKRAETLLLDLLFTQWQDLRELPSSYLSL